MRERFFSELVFCILLLAFFQSRSYGSENLTADSTKHKLSFLDSLSAEDLALFNEYKDSFDLIFDDVKDVFNKYKRQIPFDTSVVNMNKSSHMEIGLDFSSRVLSNGRDVSIKGVTFSPSVMYYHKLGLYAAFGMGFFTDSSIRHAAKIPVLYISPGFYRTFFKRWSVGISYSRSWALYAKNVFERGLLNNTFGFYSGYDFWQYITVGVSARITWSSNLNSKKYLSVPHPPGTPALYVSYKTLTKNLGEAYNTNLGINLRKDFMFFNKSGSFVFTLSPELYFLFGNDNTAFLQLRIVQDNRGTQINYFLSHANYFGFLDLEPALYADFRIRNFDFNISFHCAIPFNEYDYTTATRIRNPHHYYPYAEAGLKYLFMIKKKAKKKRD